MAKQKLTPEKRAALRKELSRMLAAGVAPGKIMKTLSVKYGISTEGMRWYVKGARASKKESTPSSAPAPQPKAARGPARKATKAVAKKKRRSPKASRNGQPVRLPGLLHTMSEKSLKYLLAAKKLVPSLETARRRAAQLQARIHKMGLHFRVASRKANKIARKIQKLAKG